MRISSRVGHLVFLIDSFRRIYRFLNIDEDSEANDS